MSAFMGTCPSNDRLLRRIPATRKRLWGRKWSFLPPPAVSQSYCNGFSATGHSAFVSAAVAPVGSKRITPEASEQKLR